MQLPLSWLKSLFPYDYDLKTLDHTLTKAGIEVDLIEPFLPPFSGVVVAKVLKAGPHPDAKKLQVTEVTDGQNTYQVVCGASNCREGLIVAFAKPGAVLGDKDPFEIKERALRGVLSQGMLCSADELGLSQVEEAGIIEFDESFPLGADVKSLVSDHILHISVTPNLGHTLSVLGIARELSAFLQKPFKEPSGTPTFESHLAKLPIKVESQECPDYHAYHLSDIDQKTTPFLIQHRLRLAGFNPKNIVVDILNYVMFERGQPMHSFDAAKLHNLELTIKTLDESESFEALNGKSYNMPRGLLAIKTGSHSAAIAGVMGSQATSCSDQTKDVVLESALFTPQAIRRSIKALDLRSDAASRFEKGVDSAALVKALDYASALLQHYTNAKITGFFHHHTQKIPHVITLRVSRTNKLLGTHLTSFEMATLLERLDMKVLHHSSDSLEVTRPSYRNDLSIEEDLIEEIGRLYGLEHLQGSLSYKATAILDNPLYTFEKPLKKALFAQGLQEVLTCDLLSKNLAHDFKLDKGTHLEPIEVLHPRSLDQCTLRMSLLSSLIPVVKKNLFIKETNLALFEVGKIHAKDTGKFLETLQAGVLLCGDSTPYYFDPKPKAFDFFDLKGIIEGLLDDLAIKNTVFEITHDKVFHPYQQLKVTKEGELIVKLGQVHPELLKAYDIDHKVFYAELSVLEALKFSKLDYPIAPLPTQPYIERDWTVSVKLETAYEELQKALYEKLPEHFESVTLLDIYIQEDVKNMTLRFRYRDKEKSLESSYIDQIHQNFITGVAKKLGLSL